MGDCLRVDDLCCWFRNGCARAGKGAKKMTPNSLPLMRLLVLVFEDG